MAKRATEESVPALRAWIVTEENPFQFERVEDLRAPETSQPINCGACHCWCACGTCRCMCGVCSPTCGCADP